MSRSVTANMSKSAAPLSSLFPHPLKPYQLHTRSPISIDLSDTLQKDTSCQLPLVGLEIFFLSTSDPARIAARRSTGLLGKEQCGSHSKMLPGRKTHFVESIPWYLFMGE